MIFYKQVIKKILECFWRKCFIIKQFREDFGIKKGFKILKKEGHGLELGLKDKNTNSIYYSKPYALQLYHNALQTKLQSRRRGNHQIQDCQTVLPRKEKAKGNS